MKILSLRFLKQNHYKNISKLDKNNNSFILLDALRALAVLLMLTNHYIARFVNLESASQSIEFIFFITSMAPVLFFFVTGLGYGVAAATQKKSMLVDTLIKVFILLSLDYLMRGANVVFGLDFLAFIGLSMLILHFIRNTIYGIQIAIIATILLFLMRFLIPAVIDLDSNLYLSAIFGQSKFDNFSYWFTPWLIYPLLGFIAGRIIVANSNVNTLGVNSLLLIFGVSIAILSCFLSSKGMVLFRWGTVSFNFFVASIGFLMVVFCAFNSSRNLPSMFKVTGVVSLVVVPVHYFILDIYSLVIQQFDYYGFTLLIVTFVALSILLSIYISHIINWVSVSRSGLSFFAFLLLLCFIWLELLDNSALKYVIIFTLQISLIFVLSHKSVFFKKPKKIIN